MANPTPTYGTVTLQGPLILESWTTATRPTSPTVGAEGLNTDTGLNEVWNGSAWTSGGGAVASVAGNTGVVTVAELVTAGLAPLASPVLTGNPTAPTPTNSDNSTSVATTAYVTGKVAAATAGVSTVNGRSGAVTLALSDIPGAAPAASPSLTGSPTAPTPAADDNDTSIATTAFVLGQAASAPPLAAGTAAVGVSTRFARADHVHPATTAAAQLAPLAPVMTFVPIGQQTAGVAFNVSLAYSIYPNLKYKDNSAATFSVLPVGSNVPALATSNVTIAHPAMSAGTLQTVSVQDVTTGNILTSNAFTVAAPTSLTITPTQPTGVVAGTPFTFQGGLGGYTGAPTLTSALDGAAPLAITGVTSTGWSETFTVATSGSHTIAVHDAANNISGSTTFTAAASGATGGARVVGPLTGATTGTWITDVRVSVPQMTNGFMNYNILLPYNWNANDLTKIYTALIYGHQNDEGMGGAGGAYPTPGASLVNQAVINGTYNTTNYRNAFPCIVLVVECDQTVDGSGANPNANFGGYGDTPDGYGNELGVIAALKDVWARYPGKVDQSGALIEGDSLGAIGALAQIVDNNTTNGQQRLFAGARCLSDQLFRPATANNSTLFDRMHGVGIIAISTTSDNNQDSYDGPAWNYYTGNAPYPTPASYASGGVSSIKAGTSSFYYIRGPAGNPWDGFGSTPGAGYRMLNADGGLGTALTSLLFSFLPPASGSSITTPSANLATITAPTTSTLIDSLGNIWGISAGVVQINGAPAGISGNVIMLAYVGGVIWQENSGFLWWSWNGSSWAGSGTTTSPLSGSAPSANLATITAPTTSVLTDASGNAWGISAGQVKINGTVDTTTASVTMLAYVSGVMWQENAAGLWYGKSSPTAAWSTGTTTSPLSGGGGGGGGVTATGAFYITGGKIIDPNGNWWVSKGLNVGGDGVETVLASTNNSAQPLTTLFPGINHVRLNSGAITGEGTASASYPLPYAANGFTSQPAIYGTFISQVTGYNYSDMVNWSPGGTWTPRSGAQHIVVNIEDHAFNGGAPPFTGQALTLQCNWYAAMATFYKSNPYVWFGNQNEMGSTDGSYSTAAIAAATASPVAIYQAIRNTGSSAIIQIMAGIGGSNLSTVGAGAGWVVADFATMYNIVWELHCYYTDGDVDPDGYFNSAAGVVAGGTSMPAHGGGGGWGIAGAQSIQSADGLVPVIFGEWGSGTGNPASTDASTLTAAIKAQIANGVGSTAWQFCESANQLWSLVNEGTTPYSTTVFGAGVAGLIATALPTFSVTPPPAQAIAAGYTTPVLMDAFSSNTVSPDGTGIHNWYTVAGLTGYSFSGGVLTISTDNSGYGAGLCTIANNGNSTTAALSTPGSIVANSGQGVGYRYGYFEASFSFSGTGYDFTGAVAAGQGNGGDWPAFWLGHALTGPSNPNGDFGEIDIFEAIPGDRFTTGGTNGSPAQNTSTLLEWTAGNGSILGQFAFNPPQGINFSTPNTWGCLWTPTSISMYFNNALVSSVAIGPGTPYPSSAIDYMSVIVGTGFNWPVVFHFVHVWQ